MADIDPEQKPELSSFELEAVKTLEQLKTEKKQDGKVSKPSEQDVFIAKLHNEAQKQHESDEKADKFRDLDLAPPKPEHVQPIESAKAGAKGGSGDGSVAEVGGSVGGGPQDRGDGSNIPGETRQESPPDRRDPREEFHFDQVAEATPHDRVVAKLNKCLYDFKTGVQGPPRIPTPKEVADAFKPEINIMTPDAVADLVNYCNDHGVRMEYYHKGATHPVIEPSERLESKHIRDMSKGGYFKITTASGTQILKLETSSSSVQPMVSG